MSDAIPHFVLSEQIRAAVGDRHVLGIVFLTFRFDPVFFERQVLPVFFDFPIAHGDGILSVVQLEQTLKSVPDGVAVYYDVGGLHQGEQGTAKLDVRRIRVNRGTGYFHPKNVFVLVEEPEADENGERQRSLVVVTLSANLTRAGWWENVEVCQIEEIAEGGATRMKDDLLALYKTVEKESPPGVDHRSLRAMREITKTFQPKFHREGDDGLLLPTFYAGNESVVEFLRRVGGEELRGLKLEIISPYFDRGDRCEPLAQLIKAFRPPEVRVYLPRDKDGKALVDEGMFDDVARREATCWAKLPRPLLKAGSAEDAGDRFVHSKVYRFFQPHPKREYLFIGSVNLTTAAHQGSANFESGLFIEVRPPRRPEFWLEPERTRPQRLEGQEPEEETIAEQGRTPLSLRHSWRTHRTAAYWDSRDPPPKLEIQAQGEPLFAIDAVAPREWIELPTSHAKLLEERLVSTAVVFVVHDGAPSVPLLVEEEDMFKKPSLLTTLTLAQILKYWAQLTPEQRNTFLEANFAALADDPNAAPILQKAKLLGTEDSLFDRFAGIYHAFHCLEGAVLESLEKGNVRDAESRLFGRQIDSLGYLLGRVLSDDERHDDIERYVMLLCARQVCRELRRERPEFFDEHRDDVKELDAMIEQGHAIRKRISDGPNDIGGFLDWFDNWFLRRAKRKTPVDDGNQEAAQ